MRSKQSSNLRKRAAVQKEKSFRSFPEISVAPPQSYPLFRRFVHRKRALIHRRERVRTSIISAMPRKRSTLLLAWYAVHKRDLPWRDERDPYRV